MADTAGGCPPVTSRHNEVLRSCLYCTRRTRRDLCSLSLSPVHNINTKSSPQLHDEYAIFPCLDVLIPCKLTFRSSFIRGLHKDVLRRARCGGWWRLHGWQSDRQSGSSGWPESTYNSRASLFPSCIHTSSPAGPPCCDYLTPLPLARASLTNPSAP